MLCCMLLYAPEEAAFLLRSFLYYTKEQYKMKRWGGRRGEREEKRKKALKRRIKNITNAFLNERQFLFFFFFSSSASYFSYSRAWGRVLRFVYVLWIFTKKSPSLLSFVDFCMTYQLYRVKSNKLTVWTMLVLFFCGKKKTRNFRVLFRTETDQPTEKEKTDNDDGKNGENAFYHTKVL